jgi:hypothetical protein
VAVARRDGGARPEFVGDVALAGVVVSPRPYAAVPTERNGVEVARRDGGARPEFVGNVALAVVGKETGAAQSCSPASDGTIDSEGD